MKMASSYLADSGGEEEAITKRTRPALLRQQQWQDEPTFGS